MGIQIFGKAKCFDTKKAERFFKERKIPVQQIDVLKHPLSRGELRSVITAVGGIDALVDFTQPDAALLRYLATEEAKEEKLLENQKLLRTPVVRCGKRAAVGCCPEVWQSLTK